ncbi:phenylacetate--CoA ligase family protein [Thalassotalea marina]|uniref:Adenylyltransferase n=1 Tax=Thalassotalea marina TaxID=1673741 RepID=A0A919EMJ5_9GAMM|nr:AMP-binding protein [Thalassotalea marina]GHF99339.1 adenylyltransferase [Thalassotalea marina]
MYTKLVSSFLFPLHEKLKKHDTVAIKKSLEQSQWLSKDELLARQQQRLQSFIANAVKHVPYYQGVFSSLGLSPDAIQSVEDLQQLPFLDKATIKQNFESMKSNCAGPTSPFTTGGSSGTPLTFLLGNERVSHDVAEKWRATRWWDVDIGDTEIVAWGSPIELGAQDKVRLIRDKLFRSTLVPAFDMDESKLLGFIEQIKNQKPKMLFGYPSVFSLIAKTADEHNIKLDDLGIKVVFVTSERLYPYQRETIESTFGAPVANGYGGRDAGFIAHQCPGGKMHISAEDIVIEIIDKEGNPVPDGEKGEIVVTHLATSDFPFIRYRTGDVAAIDPQPCSCGRGLPCLMDIEGRTTDFVVAQDGTVMHGLALIYVLRELQGINEFKIIQESKLLTRIQIVPTEKELPSALKEEIITGFKKRLGDDVEIELEVVEKIEAEKSGKFRYVISKVS